VCPERNPGWELLRLPRIVSCGVCRRTGPLLVKFDVLVNIDATHIKKIPQIGGMGGITGLQAYF